MLQSTYRLLFSKMSLPLWLVIILSITVPVLGAQPHRATWKPTIIGPSQATGVITVSPTTLTVSEPDTFDSFTITLDAIPTADVIVGISANGECTVSTASVTLNSTNWSTGVPVTVTAQDDDFDDGEQTCTVETAPADSADINYDTVDPADVTVTVQDDDTAGFQVSPTSFTINEPNGSQAVNINLMSEPTDSVTINFSSGAECDVSPASVELDSANWNTGETMTVSAVDDEIVDGTQPCTVSPTSVVTGDTVYGSQSVNSITANVQDNDSAIVQFTNASYTVAEGTASAQIFVELTAEVLEPVTVNYSTSNGTAGAADYTPTSGTLTFDGATLLSFFVPINDDAIDEPDETVNLQLSDANGATLGLSSATLTIQDNDGPPTVQFGGSAFDVGEADGQLLIPVTLSGASANTVTVNVNTTNGTATAPADYGALTNQLVTFNPGETSKNVPLTIVNDSLHEADETLTVSLSQGNGNATIGTPGTATVTILDDDTAPAVQFGAATFTVNEGTSQIQIPVTLSGVSGSTVTVLFNTSNGTATAPGDYTAVTNHLVTFNPGDTSVNVAVTIVNDSLHEPAETVNLSLSSPTNATLGTPGTATLTITDNDTAPTVRFSNSSYDVNEGSPSRQITILLSDPSGFQVTVNYATSDGSATAGSDYEATSGTATFAPGVTSATFSVPILEDNINEPTETVNLTLSAPVNATLGSPSSATLFIQDNDAAPSLFFADAAGFPSPTYTVNEGDGAALITVNLSAPSALVVTVNYETTTGGTAVPGSDYVHTSGTLVFAPFQTSRTFTVPIIDDSADDDGETIHLALSNPLPPTVQLGTPNTAVLTIVDNDGMPTVQFQQATYSVAENVFTATITVTLSAQSTSNITVTYAAQPGTATAGEDFSITSGVLEIPAGQTSSTFEVLILPDQLDEPDETVLLALSNPGNATLGTPAAASLTIVDNDPTPSINFTISNLFVSENDGFAVLPVRLEPVSGMTVMVDYETVAGTATEDSDYGGVSGTLTFSPGETIKTIEVPIFTDTATEPNEMFTVQLNAAVNAILTTPDVSTVTIFDGERTIFSLIFPSYFQSWDVDEPNDSCGEAYAIKVSETYQFLPDDQDDWYTFTLEEPANVFVEVTNFTPLDGQTAVMFWESCDSMTLVGHNGTAGIERSVDLGFVEPGIYRIYVSNDGAPSLTQPYNLRVVINNE